jgi:ketosteroid isomerase-like protein
MTTKEPILDFYDGLAKQNDKWHANFSDDMAFSDSGLNINLQGKEAVITSYQRFLPSVKSFKIKQMIVEGANACAVVSYHYVSPKGATLNQDVAEVWSVQDGKLKTLTIYFDITAYRNFMKG